MWGIPWFWRLKSTGSVWKWLMIVPALSPRRWPEGRKGTRERDRQSHGGSDEGCRWGSSHTPGGSRVSFIFFLQQLKNGKQMLWGDLVFLGNWYSFLKNPNTCLGQSSFCLFLTKTSEGYTGRHPFLKALWFRLNTNSSKQILHTLACFNNLYLCFEEGEVVISIHCSL